MALATLSDAPCGAAAPSPGPPRLSARMASLHDGLSSLLSDLDPGLLAGRDAAALYAEFCRLERLVTGAKTLLAPRIAESGLWELDGHRSPASQLAELEGGSAGQARRTLDTGRRLAGLPGTEAAVRRGALSGPKLAEITHAASLDPSTEGTLLDGSESEPLHVIKERCAKVRTTAAAADPPAALARIHAERHFTSWSDADGAFCFSGRDSAERGAKLLARLAPVAGRLRHDRRTGASGATGTGVVGPTVPESEAALLADALFLLVDGTAAPGRPAVVSGDATTGPAIPGTPAVPIDQGLPMVPAGPDHESGPADPTELSGPANIVAASPPTTVIVRVDLAALRRGRALPGELCELDGHGPVAVDVVRSLVDDAFLACVFTESGDIRAVAHLGRTINAHLRTALALRDRHCVVPRCGVAYSLEIDHVHPLERGGRTELSNLALLCRHHHRMKTYEGWTLERTGPTDEDPRWSFTPLAPFGQEPDLGLDRPDDPPEPVPRP